MTKQDREDGNFNDFITSSPLAEIYDADGKYTKYINSEGNYNPLYRAQHYGREVSRDNYRLNFFMDVKPFKGFNYRLNTSVYNLKTVPIKIPNIREAEEQLCSTNHARRTGWLRIL